METGLKILKNIENIEKYLKILKYPVSSQTKLYKATRPAACWKMREVALFTRRVLEMAAEVITDLPAVTSRLGGFPRCKR